MKRILFIFGILYIIGIVLFLPKQQPVPDTIMKLYNKKAVYELVVESTVHDKGTEYQCTAEVQNVIIRGHRVPIKQKVMLHVKKDAYKQNQKLQYKTKILCKAVLLPVEPVRNLGAFPYDSYLKTRKIYGQIYLEQKEVYSQVSANPTNTIFDIYDYAYRLKDKLINIYLQCLNKEAASLIIPMVLGDNFYLSTEIRNAFSAAGVSHVIAVSGFHIAVMIAVITLLVNYFSLSPLQKSIIILVTLLFYNIVTGFAPSIVRATLMAVYLIIGRVLGRDTDLLTSLMVSALCILMINPYWLYDAGFLLSYSAVLGLIVITPSLQRKLIGTGMKQKLRELAASTLAAQISTMPIICTLFYQFSVVGIFLNLIIIPLSGIVLLLGLLVGMIGFFSLSIARILGMLLNVLIQGITWLIEICNKIPHTIVITGHWELLAVIGYYLIAAAVILQIQQKKEANKYIRYVKILSMGIGTLLVLFTVLKPEKLEVHYIDVGQGDSSVIIAPNNKTILIDGGGRPGNLENQFDVGERIVVPYLKYNGIAVIDYLIVTHPDADHIKGTLSVLDQISVRQILLSNPIERNELFYQFIKKAKEKKISIYLVQGGETLRLQKDLYGQVLHPYSKAYQGRVETNNDTSVVLQLQYKQISFLFTGDLEQQGEKMLQEQFPTLKVNIIKCGHHGSKYSTNEAFLSTLQPQISIVSVGPHNLYQHPHKETLNRLKERDIDIYRTDLEGAVTIESDGNEINIKTMLNPYRRLYIMNNDNAAVKRRTSSDLTRVKTTN